MSKYKDESVIPDLFGECLVAAYLFDNPSLRSGLSSKGYHPYAGELHIFLPGKFDLSIGFGMKANGEIYCPNAEYKSVVFAPFDRAKLLRVFLALTEGQEPVGGKMSTKAMLRLREHNGIPFAEAWAFSHGESVSA